MPSYQDIESRLITVEEKLDFMMKTFSVTKQYASVLVPGQVIRETKNLLEVYREMKGLGAEIIPQPPTSSVILTDKPTEDSSNDASAVQ